MFASAASCVGVCEILPRIFLTCSFPTSVYGATCLNPAPKSLSLLFHVFLGKEKLDPVVSRRSEKSRGWGFPVSFGREG